MRLYASIAAFAVTTVSVNAATPQAAYLGHLGSQSGAPVSLNTLLSDFDTEIGLWDAQGQLVMTNDDAQPGVVLQSELILSGLAPGRYYAAFMGYNASFGDNFFVQPGTNTGLMRISIDREDFALPVTYTPGNNNHAGPYWYSFDIVGDNPADEYAFGVVEHAGVPFAIETDPSGITGDIVVWNGQGEVIALQELANTTGNGRRVSFDSGLAAGRYYIGMQSQGDAIADDFMQIAGIPTAQGETEILRIGSHIEYGFTAGDEGYVAAIWSFDIADACTMPVCDDPDAFMEFEPPHNPFTETDTFNGGCVAASGPSYSYAVLGNTYCGTSSAYFNSVLSTNAFEFYGNDTDWYEFYVPQRTQINLTMDAALDMVTVVGNFADIQEPCDPLLGFPTITDLHSQSCTPSSRVFTLDPGRYALVMFASLQELFPDLLAEKPYQFTLNATPLEVDDLGVVATAGRMFDIDTSGANFDTEIGLFDDNGNLIASNDDEVPGSVLTSALRDLVLTEGVYTLAVAGYNVYFDDGYSVDIRVGGAPTASGLASVKVGTALSLTAVDVDRVAWFQFEVEPNTPCPADINNDGLLNFFDVSAFLNAFNTMNPVADFTGDGVFNFFDVSSFLSAYNAGCP